jgi:hypothetical protein
MERSKLKQLHEAEYKGKYHVEISKRFVALEDFGVEVKINSAWETFSENINISAKESLGYYGLKKHKP